MGYDDEPKRKAMAEQVALLTIRGVGLKEIHKQLNDMDMTLTRAQVIALKRHPQFHEVMKREVQAVIDTAQTEAKTGFAALIPEATAALKEMIADHHIGAITLVYKGIGVLDPAPEDNKQAQSLTVILPNMEAPKDVKEVIPVRSKTIKES